MPTIATLFSGGEGFGTGADAAGYRHVWGVEFDAAIAAVAHSNGFETLCSAVEDIDYAALARPDHLHASPSCKKASIANKDRGETPEDRSAADAVCRAISALLPATFSLENVRGYESFESFRRILATLRRHGYNPVWRVLNSADYGVPQTRERLILMARRHGRIWLPEATHARADKLTPLFDTRQPWIGWYAAIADLVSTLPPSQFARWQLARLPEERAESVLYSNAKTEYSDGARTADEPLFTVTSGSGSKRAARAWLVDGDGNRSREPTVLDSTEPSMTVQAWHGRRPIQAPRAWLSSGRVVRMTPRALARFQSFSDTYQLPDRASLACTVIGNAVPPLLAQRMMECL